MSDKEKEEAVRKFRMEHSELFEYVNLNIEEVREAKKVWDEMSDKKMEEIAAAKKALLETPEWEEKKQIMNDLWELYSKYGKATFPYKMYADNHTLFKAVENTVEWKAYKKLAEPIRGKEVRAWQV